jgi:RNA polymerase sigma-70 factor (ECF subfamily)
VARNLFVTLAKVSSEGMLAEAVPGPDLDELALEDLMVRYQCADHAAAAELVRQMSPLLMRFLSGPVYTRRNAEDLLQECWLRIHKARHTYRPGDPLMPWIFAIARHTRVDAFRRQRHVESHELAVERLPDLPAPAPRGAVELDLLGLVDELPESQREVIFMLKVCGMSLEEVARATSSTIGAVKQKAHRAYEKLRVRLTGTHSVSAKP